MDDNADDDVASGGRRKPRRRRGPRKASASYLENSAAHYLGRFPTTSRHLRELLMGKVRRSVEHHGTDPDEGRRFVDDVIAKFERLGYLDDQAYAAMRARGLLAKGTPLRGIRYMLAEKGVQDDIIETAIAALHDEESAEDLDMAAAVRLARRRRLGPYRSEDPDTRAARREKDLAALARAGFSYDVARRVIEAETVEELEQDIY